MPLEEHRVFRQVRHEVARVAAGWRAGRRGARGRIRAGRAAVRGGRRGGSGLRALRAHVHCVTVDGNASSDEHRLLTNGSRTR